MKRRVFISSFLSATMIATCLTACSSDTSTTSDTVPVQTNSDGQVLLDSYAEPVPSDEEEPEPTQLTFTDSTAWYTVSEMRYGDEEYQNEYGSETSYASMYYDSDKLIVNRTAYSNGYSELELYAYSHDGSVIDYVNIRELAEPFCGDLDQYDYWSACILDGMFYELDGILYAEILSWGYGEDGEYYEWNFTFEYDVVNCEMMAFESDEDRSYYNDLYNRHPSNYLDASFNLDSAFILVYEWSTSDYKVSAKLDITCEDGRTGFVPLELGDDINYLNVIDVGYKDADTLFVIAYNESGTAEYFDVDLNTMTATCKTSEYTWINQSIMLSRLYSDSEMGIYYVDGDKGINRLNFENSCVERVVNFNYCNLSRRALDNAIIVGCDETSVTLITGVDDYLYWDEAPKTMTFTIADSNPFADRIILTAASLNGYDDTIYESIYQFNNMSDEYYIVIDSRYDINNLESQISGVYGESDSADALSGISYLGDQMSVDIIAGEGPDIIFNASSLTQLNKSDYLVDLMPYVNDSSLYYTNIFEGCATDGSLYQLPLTFVLECISTTDSSIAADQVGFTFEQYNEFVSGPCNGTQPIFATAVDTMDLLYSTIVNDCYSDGAIDLDVPAFIALAEYMKNDYVENTDCDFSDVNSEVQGLAMGVLGHGDTTCFYRGAQAFGYYIGIYGDYIADTRILGLPSYDGRSAQFSVVSSVGISSSADSVEGCIEFLQLLLSDEMQADMISSRTIFDGLYNPVNRAAFNSVAQRIISRHNEVVAYNLATYTNEEIIEFEYVHEYIDGSAISMYEDVIEACSANCQIDAPVMLIIREEIQAYFADQKDLASTIDIMENRINTYLQER